MKLFSFFHGSLLYVIVRKKTDERAAVRGGTFFEKVRKWMGNHENRSVME